MPRFAQFPADESLATASGGSFARGEFNRKGVISPVGSERPENCPVDSFQWRTGGSPGQSSAKIEVADRSSNRNLVGGFLNRKGVISPVESHDT